MSTIDPPTPEDISTLSLIKHIISAFSFIGCSLIIVFFLRTRKFWTFSGKLIIFLVSSNLIYSITNLISLFYKDFYQTCKVDGPFRTFSILSSFYWAGRISLLAFRAIVSKEFDPNKSMGYILGITVPLVISL